MTQKTINIRWEKGVSCIIFIVCFILIFPHTALTQKYQQLLVTNDGKNALIYIKRLPIPESSIIPFEISVQWVDKDLNPIEDNSSRIIFKTEDLKVSPDTFLKLKSEKKYIHFNYKTQLNFSYNEKEYKGGEIVLSLYLFYLPKSAVNVLKTSWKEFFFKNPGSLTFKTSISKSELEHKPKFVVQYRGFTGSDGARFLTMGKKGKLIYWIKNTGNAKSKKLNISIREESGIKGLSFEQNYEIAALDMGQSTILKIPVKADYTLKDGKAIFKISFSKSNKYAPKPIICNLTTKAIVDNEKPLITITAPVAQRGFKIVVNSDEVLIRGIVQDNVAVSKLLINSKAVALGGDGSFTYLQKLPPGETEVRIVARDFSNNSASEILLFSNITVMANAPVITWEQPYDQISSSSKKSFLLKSCIEFAGTINSAKIFVNNKLVRMGNKFEKSFYTDCDYQIEEEINLNNGENRIVFELDYEGGSIKSERIINYNSFGTYYALLIGVEDYIYLNQLNEPIDDAEKLKKVLTNYYSFEEKNIFFLKNPTRNDILDVLDDLVMKVGKDDNLLIFYAGHGFWDKSIGKEGEGFWLPVDAKLNKRSNWISNSSLTNYLGGIKSKNTLLVSDACFSGGIFRSVSNRFDNKSIERLYELPCRKAMTSGTLNVVPDHSVFMEYFIKRLKQNKSKYLPSRTLFSQLEEAVRNNSDNIPQFGTIQKTGDEGGDFIFIKK